MESRLSPEHALKLERDIAGYLAGGSAPAAFFAGLIVNVPSLVSAVTSAGEVLFCSPHHLALSGVASELSGLTHIDQLFPAFVQKRFPPSLLNVILEKELRQWELTVQHKNGRTFRYDMRHRVVFDERRQEKIVLTIGVDVTESFVDDALLREQKSRLNYLSFHDPLTGLANRSLFYDRVQKSLSRARRAKTCLALLLLDLDRFKNINDSLGHDAGDSFLKVTAQRLSDVLRETDTVARLSADEFVIVLENIAEARDIESISTKILESIAQTTTVQGHEISCTASIGVSLFPKDGDGIDQLLKHADVAMSRAKRQGKNRAQFYLKTMTDEAVNYLLLENDLRKAIDNGDLELHYQPQVELRSNKIVGLEALVRWRHKDRGLISPGAFIPLAEETGLIDALGSWVLYAACAQFKQWQQLGIDVGKVSVNMSARQFRQEHFDQLIVRTLLQSRLSPEYLELELTESSVMENAAETIDILNCLAEMGLSLALDDFGTGYSSLAYLKRFPINKLKIDRSFVRDLEDEGPDAAIAKSIIDLGHNMGLQVIAEGVETEAQKRWLKAKACDQVQGFYYSPPLPHQALTTLLMNQVDCVVASGGVPRFVTR